MTTAADDRTITRLCELRQAGHLDLPAPGRGETAARWARLAKWGRADLPLARLAEGHVDAVTILREAGSAPDPDALYGVWAARSGGTGAVLRDGILRGTVRFCSGAHDLDRALVVASTTHGSRIVDLDLNRPGVQVVAGTWLAPGMHASDTVDVVFDEVPVGSSELRGGTDFYTARPGFSWGGAGVAAVWLGGADGVVARLRAQLRERCDDFQRAHLGSLHAGVEAAYALMDRTAAAIDAAPERAHRTAAWTLRAAVEQVCRTVLDVAPRTAGVAALSRTELAQRLADLGMYVRQHHGERDLAALGAAVLDAPDHAR